MSINPIDIKLVTSDSQLGQDLLQGLDVEESKAKEEEKTQEEEVPTLITNESGIIVGENGEAPELPEDAVTTKEAKNTTSDLSGIIQKLYDDGIIDLEEDEDKATLKYADIKERLEEYAEKRSKKSLDDYVNSFSGVKKQFLEIEGGFSSDEEAIQMAKDLQVMNTITDEQIDTDESLAEAIIAKNLSLMGMEDKEVKEQIETYKDLGKLSDKAKSYAPKVKARLTTIVNDNKAAAEARESKKLEAQKSYFEKINNIIDTSEEIVPGMKTTKRFRDNIKKKMTNVVHRDAQGREYNELGYKQLQNPEQFTVGLEALNALGLLNFDKQGNFSPDFSKLSKLVEGKVTSKVDKLVQDEQKSSTTPVAVDEESSDAIALLKQAFKVD